MKKFLIVLCGLTIAGNASAWYLGMKNNSDGQVQIDVTFGGGGVCKPDTFYLEKGVTKGVQTGFCCPKSIIVRALRGSATGKTTTYQLPQTGFGISCRNNQFVIYNPLGNPADPNSTLGTIATREDK